jgi:hypothetical protein
MRFVAAVLHRVRLSHHGQARRPRKCSPDRCDRAIAKDATAAVTAPAANGTTPLISVGSGSRRRRPRFLLTNKIPSKYHHVISTVRLTVAARTEGSRGIVA